MRLSASDRCVDWGNLPVDSGAIRSPANPRPNLTTPEGVDWGNLPVDSGAIHSPANPPPPKTEAGDTYLPVEVRSAPQRTRPPTSPPRRRGLGIPTCRLGFGPLPSDCGELPRRLADRTRHRRRQPQPVRPRQPARDRRPHRPPQPQAAPVTRPCQSAAAASNHRSTSPAAGAPTGTRGPSGGEVVGGGGCGGEDGGAFGGG
jgi:hypothetical protein